MATLIDGKALAEKVQGEVKQAAAELAARHGRAPGLTVVLVGDNPASKAYVGRKEKASLEAGIAGRTLRLPATISEADLLGEIDRLNRDPATDGILLQLPLPDHISADRMLQAIAVEKDVDGFHPINQGNLLTGRPGFVPCTPKGMMRMLAETGLEIAGKRAVVVGRSNIVGKPMALLLLAENATVTICHSRTRDLPALVATAEIVVAAIGKPLFVKGDWIKPGAIVLDVGINRVADGRLVGDVDTQAAMANASFITPVPGGVGPMTVACLLENTVAAARARMTKSVR